MTPTAISKEKSPTLHGQLSLVPLSTGQFEQMLEKGILPAGSAVELSDGFMLGIDRGNGQDRPVPCSMSANLPRYHGLEVWPLTVQQFERMSEEGILSEDDPIELIDGYMVSIDRGGGPGMPPGPKHSIGTQRVTRNLTQKLHAPWFVLCQSPVRLGDTDVAGAGSNPEPDVAVVRGPDSLFVDHHPEAGDLGLLVETAHSSLAVDKGTKKELYARANIPRYWILNIGDRRLETFEDPDPSGGKYLSHKVLAEDQQVTLKLEGISPITFLVKDLLP